MPLPRRRNGLAALRARRNADAGALAVDRRHLDRAAERRRRHRQRHAAVDVGAVALEQPVRRHRHEDVEVAGRAAAHAGLALAGEPDAGAVLDAGRNRHLQRLLALHAAGAAAGPAGIADHLAAAAAARAGALDGEEARTARAPGRRRCRSSRCRARRRRLAPLPLQASQRTAVGTRIVDFVPANACSSVISRL